METPTTGTVLQEGSPIVFGSTLAKGPSHYANLGFGGYHQVDTLAERNAIPAERRPEGLPCYVRETGLAYVLEGGITNAHWQAMPGPAAIAAKADATALSAQVTKQAGDLLSRDTMLGVNGRHLPFIIAASSDLKPRSLDAHPGSIPRPSGVVAASQSGTTVTCSDSSYVFSYQEIGRRIVWADGSDAVIVAVPSDASPVLVVTVDRSQTVAAQPFRVQASGICGVVEGDSTAYSNKTDLRAILYRQWDTAGPSSAPHRTPPSAITRRPR